MEDCPVISLFYRPCSGCGSDLLGFITRRLRHLSLGECRRGLRHFWSHQTRLSFGPDPDPPKKWPCATLIRLLGCSSNTDCPAISHFDQLYLGEHGSGRMCPGCRSSWSMCTLTGILDSQGSVPPGSNPHYRGWVYRLAPELHLFSGMPTGHEAFWKPPGTSGLRPYARTHLNRPYATLVRLVRRSTNTAWLATALCWGFSVDCLASVPGGQFLEPQGAVHPFFNSPWRVKFIAKCLRRLF